MEVMALFFLNLVICGNNKTVKRYNYTPFESMSLRMTVLMIWHAAVKCWQVLRSQDRSMTTAWSPICSLD